MSRPSVTCVCLTYNRFPRFGYLVGEAVESFLRQDCRWRFDVYLLVINDCKTQELSCATPSVRVINVGKRFRSLGEKYEYAFRLVETEYACWWEDDDISMPWRVSQGIDVLELGYDYYNPGRYYFMQSGKVHTSHHMGVCFNCSMFRTSAVRRNGPFRGGADVDANMDRALRADQLTSLFPGPPPDVCRWPYIYRWGESPCHLSGDPAGGWAASGRMPVQGGQYEISPGWRRDYERLARAAALRETSGEAR